MNDSMNRNPAYVQKYLDWQDVHLERRRAALSGAEAYRWRNASRWWMLAAGCALASLFMLAVTAWRCVQGSP